MTPPAAHPGGVAARPPGRGAGRGWGESRGLPRSPRRTGGAWPRGSRTGTRVGLVKNAGVCRDPGAANAGGVEPPTPRPHYTGQESTNRPESELVVRHGVAVTRSSRVGDVVRDGVE